MFGRFKERFSMGKKLAKKQPKILRYEELEQRVLFSADVMAGLDNLSVDEQVLVEDVISADQFAGEAAPATVEQTAAETRCELVMVNPNVADYEQLTADLQGSDNKRIIDVVVLEADRDGIAQVSEILAGRLDLAAVHFITHGADGQINLGNSWLNRNSLQQNSEAVTGWGRALTEKGDFLFYGCNIAADSPGRTLLNDIALLTGADVAASDDLTGQAQFGGDWVLEYDNGNIETAAAINSATQQNWNGVLLTTFTVNTTADTVDVNTGDGSAADALGKTSLRAAIMEANVLGGVNEIILNAGTYTLSLGPAGDDNAVNGDLDVTGELTITGAGADVTIIDGNSLDSVFNLKGNAANLTLTDLTIKGGNSHGHGGGIHVGHNLSRLSATRVIVSGNNADKGAGIYNHGTMTLTDVVISNNGDAGTSQGGGIYSEKAAILNGVTISGNRADDGGGIYHDNSAVSLSLTNVTVSGNTATNKGGGLHTQKPAAIVNSTFTLNSAATGGGISNNGGTIDIKNTIVAQNLATLNPDVDGGFNSQGNNLIGDKGTAGGFSHGVKGDQAGTAVSPINPRLDSLQDNDGFTQTHALRAGSPAIDAGDNSVGLTDDQRQYPRPIDGNYDATATSDIGAFEYTPVILSYYLDGVGDGSDIPSAALKTSAPADPTLDNFDPGRDAFAGLTLAGSDLGLNEADTTKYQQWITAPGAIWLRGPASLSLWSAMKEFDMTKAGSITAYLVDSDAAGSDLTEIASATVTRADWDVANTGTWIEETFDFGAVDYALNAGRYLGVKIVVNNGLAADAMWLAYDVTGSPSKLTAVSAPNTEPTGSVNIDNANPAQGDDLRASNSLADADGLSGPISYQWQRDGVNIGGAGGNSYTTVQADVGTVITVVASYTDDLGFDESVSSAGTAAVTNVNDPGTLTIDNTSPTQGDILTAGVADPDGAGGSISYQWYRNGAAIGGATAAGYTTTQADVGKVMTVTADYTDDLLTVESITSAPTLAVANINDSGTLTIDNPSPSQGDILTAGVADPDGAGGSISYQWYRNGAVIGGATAAGYTTTQADVGKVMTVTADYTDDLLTVESITSAPTLAVANINDSGTLTIDNTLPTQGDILTAGVADPDGAGGSISYQWYRNGAVIGGATAAGYTTTQADVGKVMTVTANYTDDLLTVESITSAPTLAVTNVNDPGTLTIDNTSPTQGDILTAGVADPDGAGGSISYQWYRNGAAIGGATAAGYTTTQADVGKVMTVTANYTDDLLTVESITSAPTLAVTNANDSGSLTIDNTTPSQGDTLTAGVVDPDGAGGAIAYQWYRNGAAIGGATAAGYTTTQADVGKVMTVTANYTDDLLTVESITSAPTLAVANVNDSGTLTIDNPSPSQGDILTAGVVDPDGAGGAIAYQWYRNGAAIGGATAAGYTTTQADVGKVMTVTANYTDDLLTVESITSAPTLAVTNVNDPGTLTIDNTSPTQGDILTAGVADPDGAGGSISYQWYRNGAAIGGATAAGYTTTQADVGKVMTVTANYTDDLLTVESITSAPTLAVANVNDSGSLTIDNTTPSQGDTLTAGVVDPDGAGGAIAYQWYRNGAAIGGATAAGYTTTQADVGKVMTVTADYTDDLLTVESITSAPTLAVANVNDSGTLTINNPSPSQGDILTAGVVDPDGAGGSIAYQWYRNGAAIGGATAAAYTTTQADVGKVMTVTADYTDDLSALENLTSGGTAAVINVNDAPVLGNNYLSISEGATVIFDSSMLSATDVDNPDPGLIFNISVVNAGQFERVSTGSVTTAFSQADITAGEVRLVHDGSQTAPSYNVSVSDGSAGANPTAAAIHFTNVNDAPLMGQNNLAITGGATVTLDSSMLSATDVDHPDSSLIFNVSGVTAGYFAFARDPATPVTSFDQSDITAGNLVFVHDGSEAQPGYSVSVTDGTDSTAASPANIAFSNRNETAPPSIDFLTLPENAADSPDSTVPSATNEVKPGPSEASNKPDAGAGQLVVSSDAVITVTGLDQGDPADGTVVFVQDGHKVSAADRTDFRQTEFGHNDPNPNSSRTYFSYQRLKLLLEAHNIGELKTALGNLNIKTLSSSDYDLVRNSMDAIKAEIGKEIQLGKTVVGSAIAASIGLSVGYVVWLLKGGSLLASVLSSLPAWQLADPLAILVGHKGDEDDDDDDDDDESLETIIDDGSKRDEDKESSASELNNIKKESVKK